MDTTKTNELEHPEVVAAKLDARAAVAEGCTRQGLQRLASIADSHGLWAVAAAYTEVAMELVGGK